MVPKINAAKSAEELKTGFIPIPGFERISPFSNTFLENWAGSIQQLMDPGLRTGPDRPWEYCLHESRLEPGLNMVETNNVTSLHTGPCSGSEAEPVPTLLIPECGADFPKRDS